MAAEASALVRPTANAVLEDALRARLQRRRAWGESFGQLEKIAFQLGLVQNSSSPSFSSLPLASRPPMTAGSVGSMRSN